jgi:hypothetical protein
MELTSEQQAIVAFVAANKGNLVIEALAGTGKTFCLLEALNVLPQKSALVCAFNKQIATEILGRLPVLPRTRVVHVKTFHAQGLAIIKKHFPGVKIGAEATEDIINTAGTTLKTPFNAKRAAVKILRQWKEQTTAPLLIPTEEEILALGLDRDLFGRLGDINIQATIDAVRLGYRLSLETKAPETIDFCDMVWLPIVKDLAPPSRYQAILVDELQDISPPQFELMRRLLIPGGRFIGVGDRNQCHPAGVLIQTTVGQIPIEHLDPKRHKIIPWNRKAQRSTGQRSFKLASCRYAGALLKVSTIDHSVEVTPNHKFLCRWAKRSDVYITYIMHRADRGYRVGWCQLFTKDKHLHFVTRWHLEQADAAWIVAVHDTREKASIHESILAAKYGLFTATFKPVNAQRHREEAAIKKIFAGVSLVDQRDRARRCLTEYGRDLALPFFPRPGKNPRDHDGRPTYFITHAANLIPGLMTLPLPDGQNRWTSITGVERRIFKGLIYSLDVDIDHNYSADGLIVMNSIYGWRGADADKAFRFAREQFGAKFLPLTTSFRCSTTVVHEAQQRVPDLKAHPEAVPGSVSHARLSQLPHLLARGYSETIHTFILSRNNAALLDAAMYLWREKVSFQINAGREILEPLYGIIDGLRLTSTDDFKVSVGQWHAAEMFRAERSGSTAWADRIDEQAKMLLATAGYTAPKKIKQLFQEMLKASGSGVLLSTVHKVKGLEADRVFLLKQTFACGRVVDDDDDRPPPQEEINIEYVAITRAREHLTWVDIDPQARVVVNAEDELDRLPECTDGLSIGEIGDLFVYAERRALELMESDEALADRWMARAEMLNKVMKEAR